MLDSALHERARQELRDFVFACEMLFESVGERPSLSPFELQLFHHYVTESHRVLLGLLRQRLQELDTPSGTPSVLE